MAENDGNEEKNLPGDKKVEAFIEEIKAVVKQAKETGAQQLNKGMFNVEFNEETQEYTVYFEKTSIAITTCNKEDSNIVPDPDALGEYLEFAEETKKQEVANLEVPEITPKELEEFLKRQKEEHGENENETGEKANEEPETARDELDGEEQIDEAQKENEPEDKKKEAIAKKYNVNASQVIHISRDRKITEHKTFKGVADWAKDYDDVYILPGEDEYSSKFIGSKNGEQEEIKNANRQFGGKNPDVNIKLVHQDSTIEEIRPLSIYEIDNTTSIAITRDEMGRKQAIICRQEGGDEKTYWGNVIPEASGKNVFTRNEEVSEIVDYTKTSIYDLDKKGQALNEQNDLEGRGMPSGNKKGAELQEIEGNKEQRKEMNTEEIAKYLQARDGVLDSSTRPTGFYKNKAEKVLDKFKQNEEIQFDEAIEQVEEESKHVGNTGDDENEGESDHFPTHEIK